MREGYHAAFAAINEAIAKQPQSVFTYEYLLSACDGCDPRVLNYVYFQAMQNVTDNALLLTQYGEFLEEMNEYEAACEVFRRDRAHRRPRSVDRASGVAESERRR